LLPLALAVFLLSNPFKDLEPLSSAWARLENAEAVNQGLHSISPEASVVTTNNYAPHLANRQRLYIIGDVSPRKPPPDPDVVFFNLSDYRYTRRDQYYDYLAQLDPQRYGVTLNTGGVVVIERDKGSPAELAELLARWDQG
jgi:hypothetical protein